MADLTESEKPLREFPCIGPITCIAVSDNYLVVGSEKFAGVHVFDLGDPEQKEGIPLTGEHNVHCAAISLSPDYMLTASEDREVHIWKIRGPPSEANWVNTFTAQSYTLRNFNQVPVCMDESGTFAYSHHAQQHDINCRALVDGELIWSYRSDDFGVAVAIKESDDVVVATDRNSNIVVIGGKSGEPLWHQKIIENSGSFVINLLSSGVFLISGSEMQLPKILKRDTEQPWALTRLENDSISSSGRIVVGPRGDVFGVIDGSTVTLGLTEDWIDTQVVKGGIEIAFSDCGTVFVASKDSGSAVLEYGVRICDSVMIKSALKLS